MSEVSIPVREGVEIKVEDLRKPKVLYSHKLMIHGKVLKIEETTIMGYDVYSIYLDTGYKIVFEIKKQKDTNQQTIGGNNEKIY